jgi:hypothetical protein
MEDTKLFPKKSLYRYVTVEMGTTDMKKYDVAFIVDIAKFK